MGKSNLCDIQIKPSSEEEEDEVADFRMIIGFDTIYGLKHKILNTERKVYSVEREKECE